MRRREVVHEVEETPGGIVRRGWDSWEGREKPSWEIGRGGNGMGKN